MTPRLSVVVPAFNEESLLEATVRDLRRTVDELDLPAEIVVVDDGSADRTCEIAERLARELPGVTAVHQSNQGIGGAVRTGARSAAGDFLMIWPADMPAGPEDLSPYTSHLGQADVIVGRRRNRAGYNPLMRFNAWLYPRVVGLLFGLHLRDVNWIHAYRRTAFLDIALTQRGIPMLAETLVRLRDNGATFLEVDVAMKPRAGGVASASRPLVMWQTFAGLISFWLKRRREAR